MRNVPGVLLAALFCGVFGGDALAVCPAGPPTLISPANNGTTAFGPVLLDWTAVAGAASYDIYLGLDGDPPSLFDSTAGTQRTILVEPGRTVQWKVVAMAPSCAGQASGYFFFDTTCPADAPDLRKPDQGTRFNVGQGITFTWTAVAGAAGYDVRVTPDLGVTWTTIAANLTALSFTTDALAQGDWGWHVRANFDGECAPLFSEPSSFLVSNCNIPAPNTILPANNATAVENPVTFTWSSVPGAVEYRVLVSVDGGPRTPLPAVTIPKLTQTVSGSSVVWVVQALFDRGCPPVTSEQSRFTLALDPCPRTPEKSILASPASGATSLVSPVKFDWNAVPLAIGYRVLTMTGDNDLTAHNAGTGTELTLDLPVGNGSWAVQTFFGEDCVTTLSERRPFTVSQGASCGTEAPRLLSPQNNAATVDSPVTFRWSAVPRAAAYTLFLSTSERGDDFVPYGRTEAPLTELEKFVPAGTARWFVVAHFAACPDLESEVFAFGSGVACPAIAEIPLVSPSAGAEVTSPVTLVWTSVGGGIEYRVSIETEAGATVIAFRTTGTSKVFRLPAGTFYWSVDALGDCPLSSERRSFTIREGANCAANTAPTLVSPVGTLAQPAQATSPVTFRWNPVPNAIAYRLFIARDDQPPEDSTLNADTDKEVELEAGKYRWFVNAIFEGCPSVPSAIAYFAVPREGCPTEAPAILSPQPGQVVSSSVTFLWSEVEGVERYRVIAVVRGEPILLGSTTDTSLERNLPPGEYAYIVETELDECASTRSTLTKFTVETAKNCSTSAAELSSPENGAALTEQEVDFVWTPVSGALEYAVVARLADGAETNLGNTEESHLVHAVPLGTITWRVIAFFPGCDPESSKRFKFTVQRPQNCVDRAPALLFPRNDDELPSPVTFEIVPVRNATEHRIWVQLGDEPPSIVSTTPGEEIELPPGEYQWFAEARFASCPPTFSARASFISIEALPCETPKKPEALVIGQAVSRTQYRVRWQPLPNVLRYEVQESASIDFANAQTSIVDSNRSLAFRHEVTGAPVQYFYRVRGLSACNDSTGPFSDVVGVFVVAPATSNGATELGQQGPVVQTIFIPGAAAPRTFVATTDRPWLKVSPASGTLPIEGLTLTVTADPGVLGVGTNTGTVRVEYGSGTVGGVATNDSSSSTFAMSVSLVTPVTPTGKGTPPPDALIFAAVAHAAGVNGSFFESDIRVTNLTTRTMTYDLNFTPSGVNGTEIGSSSTIEVAPGATLALDDIVATLFGSGTNGSALGMLEVRPVTPSESSGGGLFGSIATSGVRQLNTAAASRTYNFTPAGTFGQYIPATRFADFVGQGSILSLQQVAESPKFRANFGFLEASGNSAELMVRVYDTANTLLSTIPVSLQPMQHRQIGNMLRAVGLTDLVDGRVEVEVVSGNGKVTAYVSEVDNATNDPLLVSPVVKGAVRADRYVVPGMAYINTGSAFWVSDLRIFNAGNSSTPVRLMFVPQGNPGGALTRDVTIEAGEIEVLNNVVGDLFAQSNGAGGSIIITTPNETALTATARTYNQTATGTYGQYIAGVTAAESIGKDDRALQILQLEQSTRIRTNVGVAETTGRGATVEISLITPDSLVTQVVTIGLAPNEFRQIGLVDFRPDTAVYNGRVTVKVINGDGRVTAYGSAIDQITQDPTYVPAM